MKTIHYTGTLVLATTLFITTQGLFAQTTDIKTGQQGYRLHLVQEENGDKKVIDKNFASKEEMDAYIKENNIDAPEGIPTPENATTQAGLKQKPGKGHIKKEKKIIIIEKDGNGLNDKADLEIALTHLSAEESAGLIQDIINKKVGSLEVIDIQKEINTTPKPETQSNNTEPIQPPSGINDKPVNLSSLKVYPNPGNGDFHVEFNVTKPCHVKLRISDMQGKEVYAEALNNYSGKFEKNITRSGLSKGTYLMDVEAGNEKETTTVVMQ